MSSMYRMQVVKSPLVSQKKNSKKKRLQVQVETGILKSENLILNGWFQFDNHNTADTKGFDYNHIKIQSLSLNAQDMLQFREYLGKINAFKAKEQSGLDIQSFKADFSTENEFF
jgi:hypothetical protein